MNSVALEKRKLLDANAQARGRAAEGLMAGLQAALGRRRESYLAALMTKTRASGEVADQEVWKLIALADLEADLKREISAGQEATKRQQRRETNE